MPEQPVPRVKVCGLTRLEDVRDAVSAGADAVGLVHHPPSPRHLEAPTAAGLTAELPTTVLPVAVFVNVEPEGARDWARRAGARAVQLCGNQTPEPWQTFELAILRRVSVGPQALEEVEKWRGVAWAFVLDHPAAPGGTGLAVDHEQAAELALQAPCLLAGGLDQDSVAQAVRRVQPAGVDASSRLECAPGIKDPGRVLAFVRNALVELAAAGGSTS